MTVLGGLQALRSAGFHPLGPANAAVVLRLNTLTVGCKSLRSEQFEELLGSSLGSLADLPPFFDEAVAVGAIRKGYQRAVKQLTDLARSKGAHGVIALRVDRPGIDVQQELRLSGQLVAVPGERPLDNPFLSTTTGGELQALLEHGLAPRGLGIGIGIAHAHAWATWPPGRRSRMTSAGPGTTMASYERPGMTEAIQHVRHLAHEMVRRDLSAIGADGGIGSDVRLQMAPVPCVEPGAQLLIASMVSTGVVRFGSSSAPPPAIQLRLDSIGPFRITRERSVLGRVPAEAAALTTTTRRTS